MPRTRAKPEGAFATHLAERFEGLTLEEIADEVGMTTGVVSSHLAGTRSPRPLSVLRYAAALREDPAALHGLLGEHDMARLYRRIAPSGQDASCRPPPADPTAERAVKRVGDLLRKGLSHRLRAALDELDALRGELEKSFHEVIEATGAEAGFLASDSLPASDTVLLRWNVATGDAEAVHRAGSSGEGWIRLRSKSDSPRLFLYLKGTGGEAAQPALNLWPSAFF